MNCLSDAKTIMERGFKGQPECFFSNEHFRKGKLRFFMVADFEFPQVIEVSMDYDDKKSLALAKKIKAAMAKDTKLAQDRALARINIEVGK
jgi:hypothetical protein